MNTSKLLIFTSVYEGFPNVLVESLTIGTPVISTNANAGASEILLNGKGGDLIRIGDYNNLAKKIIKHFSYPKILIKKAKIAKKNLYRFETKRHMYSFTPMTILCHRFLQIEKVLAPHLRTQYLPQKTRQNSIPGSIVLPKLISNTD